MARDSQASAGYWEIVQDALADVVTCWRICLRAATTDAWSLDVEGCVHAWCEAPDTMSVGCSFSSAGEVRTASACHGSTSPFTHMMRLTYKETGDSEVGTAISDQDA